MTHRIPSLVIAVYLFLCIVLGGSSQGVWGNLALQLIGVGLILWAVLAGARSDEGATITPLYLFLLAALLLILFQLVPLPPTLWTNLPGKSWLAGGYQLLGYDVPSLPISETPYQSIMALFSFIPAIAVLIVVHRLAPSARWVAAAIVGGMIFAIAVGALQVAGGSESWAYFYEVRSPGAVGFFANQNHMATLMLLGIPMASALIVSARPERRTPSVGRYGVGIALLVLVIAGIVLNDSRAAAALSIPVLIASAALFPWATKWRASALVLAVISLGAGLALLINNPIAANTVAASDSGQAESRVEIWRSTARAIQDSFPVGTGLGSFEQVYHRYENPQDSTRQYVNHAHNDYLQIVLELGAGGLLLVILFLAWWVFAAMRAWKSPVSTPFSRAATIATAVVLAHSAVDFPMRTTAISAIFAACIVLMALNTRVLSSVQPGEPRPPRHATIG